MPGSLGQRYGVVLQELRVELLRHNTSLLNLGSANGETTVGGSTSIRDGDEGLLGSYTNQDILDIGSHSLAFAPASEDMTGQIALAGQDGLGFSEHSPGSSIVQMTGWGQFESLVRTSPSTRDLLQASSLTNCLQVTGGVGGIEAFLDGHMGAWNLGMGEQLDT